jgi:hypothetical protein
VHTFTINVLAKVSLRDAFELTIYGYVVAIDINNTLRLLVGSAATTIDIYLARPHPKCLQPHAYRQKRTTQEGV